MEVPQVDNMNILKALFHYKDDQAPLMWDQKQVDLEALRKKLVLLLISDLDISEEDISIVEDIYSNSRAKRTQQSRLEIVWLPIIDKSEDWESEKTKEKFMKKQRAMKWHTVHRPSLIAKEVIKLAKEEWHFEKKRIIVVIDAQGQVACPDAFPMIYVWGYETYPFSTSAQESQWKETPGLLELLMAPFYPEIQDSIESGQHCICLCGGEDMEWIKMFTTRAPSVASAADVVLEMIYLGKWKPNKQRQRRNTATIEREDLKLKYSLTEEKQMKFWKRLENMGHSRMQLGKRIYEDLIMQDIISLLNMGSSRGGWAVICRGSDFRIKAKGKHILDSLVNFCEWKDNIRRQDFLGALEHYLTMNPGHVDVYKHIKSYERIINIFERTQKVHCLEILKALVSARDYWQPLVYGKTKQRVTIDLLKRKKLLLLLISDCNISEKEINRLATIYEETECEIVWLPIVVAFAQKEFQYKQEKMPWYSVYHPSVINEAAIKFIREVWRYEEKTILVALDQQGRVVTPNALHLIWIWGKGAIPSTISKEEATTSREVVLWKGLSWSLDLITNDLDPIIQRWKQEDNLICLYGGEDIKWIRNFTRTAKQVAKSAAIGVQMLYVGMSNLNKRCSSNIVKITEEELSHCWKERVLIWSFWSRLQSIWHTGYQIGKSMKDDPIMKELTTLLSFDSRECGWALMSKGSGPGALVTAKGSDILECLLKYEEEWKEQALKNGFLPTLKEKLVDYHKLDKCFQLVLPEFATTNLETAECSHCRGTVEKLTFQCCGHV
ncbi:hypothetical protein JCGZ_10220 [Jatropha curcas]|uniref:Sieve element occlusion C-terminal domain-containing protein n=1 Tax=Jatropha curcas TaxID=180498 RepID=A0A067LNF3_JATCU|nr:hypothetical protein JCGZ_10220 [Jatropha curcas]